MIRHVRPLFFVVFGGLAATLVLSLSLNNLLLTRTNMTSGCPGVSGVVSETRGFYDNKEISVPSMLASALSKEQKAVLGLSTGEDKWVEVDLSDQTLTAHQGDRVVLTSPISSGLTNPTPTGEFHIWFKTSSIKMEGGNRLNNTYYYLPNVPFAMFFQGDYSIHGTYWHNNFGQPMSHGCVNTPTPIAEKLFYWVDPQLPSGKLTVHATSENPGTRVVIHE
jgi:lipoprotein-anchoring transpeptidase ErfK/SrfK